MICSTIYIYKHIPIYVLLYVRSYLATYLTYLLLPCYRHGKNYKYANNSPIIRWIKEKNCVMSYSGVVAEWRVKVNGLEKCCLVHYDSVRKVYISANHQCYFIPWNPFSQFFFSFCFRQHTIQFIPLSLPSTMIIVHIYIVHI